jgi:hypothetical protein
MNLRSDRKLSHFNLPIGSVKINNFYFNPGAFEPVKAKINPIHLDDEILLKLIYLMEKLIDIKSKNNFPGIKHQILDLGLNKFYYSISKF